MHLAAPVAFAGPTPAQKCSGSKIKATSKKASAKLKCHEKAILKGLAVDPECLAKAEDKFTDAFAKAEDKGGCLTTGDTGSMEALVDTFVEDSVAALNPPAARGLRGDGAAHLLGELRHLGLPYRGLPVGEPQPRAGDGIRQHRERREHRSAGGEARAAQRRVEQLPLPEDHERRLACPRPMPFGAYPMPSNNIDAIEDWITEGALNN